MKNEDSLAQRLNLKPFADVRLSAKQLEMGLVAPGMIRKVAVTICSKEPGTIKEVLHIVTKSDVFKIPIEATIFSPDDYERELSEQQALNKKVTNSRVREKLTQSIQRGRFSMVAVPEKKTKKKRVTGENGEDLAAGEGEEYDDGEEGSQGEDMEEQN